MISAQLRAADLAGVGGGEFVEEDDLRLRGSRLLEVVFKDGERLVVLCNSFPPKTERFFVLPVDMDSNNERILVNRDAIVSITEVES